MNRIKIKSYTKFVFLMVAFTVCLWFMIGKIEAEKFLYLASMVFIFYYRGTTTNSDTDLKDSKSLDDNQPKNV